MPGQGLQQRTRNGDRMGVLPLWLQGTTPLQEELGTVQTNTSHVHGSVKEATMHEEFFNLYPFVSFWIFFNYQVTCFPGEMKYSEA